MATILNVKYKAQYEQKAGDATDAPLVPPPSPRQQPNAAGWIAVIVIAWTFVGFGLLAWWLL
jgi:hypothetical protein